MFYKLNTRFYTQECKVGCFCNSSFRYYGIQTRKEQRMVISLALFSILFSDTLFAFSCYVKCLPFPVAFYFYSKTISLLNIFL